MKDLIITNDGENLNYFVLKNEKGDILRHKHNGKPKYFEHYYEAREASQNFYNYPIYRVFFKLK